MIYRKTNHYLGELDDITFVVILTRYLGKWVFCWHKRRKSFENPGGHVEKGETPMQAAKRELYEETGITDCELIPLWDYEQPWDDGVNKNNGRFFMALVRKLGELPESEMERIELFDEVPENFTYDREDAKKDFKMAENMLKAWEKEAPDRSGLSDEEKEFLLNSYGEEYGPEAGPWNLSPEGKYLEYEITAFFEENFEVKPDHKICNIGIGVGSWDRYLAYRLPSGSLTSIDIDDVCCKQLGLRLANEKNPSRVIVVNSDVMAFEGHDGEFDIVTMIGSARQESGLYEEIINKVISLVKPGGCLYYHTLDDNEDYDIFNKICLSNHALIDKYASDDKYGISSKFFKVVHK